MSPFGKQQGSANPMLRIGATMGVPEVLRSLGSDPAAVLAEVGIDMELFDNPSNLISYAARGQMLAHCAQRTACPHFGLLAGQQASLAAFGIVGLLAKCSRNAGEALRRLVRYMHLHVRGATTTLTLDSDLAVLDYQIYQPRVPGNSQVGDGAVAVAFNIVRELCGSDWEPIEVRFAHRKPEDVTPFKQCFRAPLRYDTEHYAVVFSSTWLSRRLPDTSPELRHLLQQEIDRLELRQEDNLSEQIRSMLRSTLVTGHASADEVAKFFSMHRRTLNRHLHALGTNYREVVDEVRFEIARQLLEDSAMEVVEMASLLGYSNASAFTRAFRRWSSTTPAKWRAMTRTGTQP